VTIQTWVKDNFLDEPDLVRSSILQYDFLETGKFPGARSGQVDADFANYLSERIAGVIGAKTINFGLDSFKFQICTEEARTWVHSDPSDYTAILYLSPDAPTNAGTGLYQHSSGISYAPSYLDTVGYVFEDWNCIHEFENQYNRLVIFPGRHYHRSQRAGFGHDKYTARLTQVFFFSYNN